MELLMKKEFKKKGFEILPHTADLKIRSHGKTLGELFENMLKGMFLAIEPEFESDETVEREIEMKSHDVKSLLVDFLSDALYLSDVHREAYVEAKISEVSETSVKAILVGKKITDFALGEIKAVTHHDVKLEKVGDEWIAEVVFDL
jgi:SHS2 domain-containing protein